MTLQLFIRHSQKPVKFAEISDPDIIFIDNYNSRKRIAIEIKSKTSKTKYLDLLMTMIHTFTGIMAVFCSYTFFKKKYTFLKYC